MWLLHSGVAFKSYRCSPHTRDWRANTRASSKIPISGHGDVLQVESLVHTGPEVGVCTGTSLVHLARGTTGPDHTSLAEPNGGKSWLG